MNITHWVPTGSTIAKWPCVEAWINTTLPDGATRTFVKGKINAIHISWNRVIKDFLATDSEWLFSTHDDVVYDPNTLVHLMSWNQPLISALIFMRQSPVVPHVWKKYDDTGQYAHRIKDTREWFFDHKDWIRFGPFIMTPRPADALVPVDFTSTSCTLIHRSVLEEMSKECGEQWFVMDSEEFGGGEDRRFFEIAARAGFQGYVDRSCIAGHLVGDIPTSSADFIAWDNISVFHNTGEPGSDAPQEVKDA